MHFRILKMIATSGFLTALECIKFISAYSAPPDSLAGLRGPNSKEKGGEGEEELGQEEGIEGVGLACGKAEGRGGKSGREEK